MPKRKQTKQDFIPAQAPDDQDGNLAGEQFLETKQIIETGTVTPTKGRFTIHCLTIIGQVVIVDKF